jgi:hypothetical protein
MPHTLDSNVKYVLSEYRLKRLIRTDTAVSLKHARLLKRDMLSEVPKVPRDINQVTIFKLNGKVRPK